MDAAITIDTADAGCALEGRRAPGTRPVAVVAPPHPEYGGNIDNPVVGSLMDGLRKAGRDASCFNWRGVGGSGGLASGDLQQAAGDYAAVVAHARRTMDAGRDGAIATGYSFGAAAAIAATVAGARISRLLLVAPPAAMIGTLELERVSQPVHIVVGDADVYAPLAAMRSLVERLPAGALSVLPGVDHFFMHDGLDAVEKAAAAL